MIAITIAVGAKYEAAAKLAVDSCEKMTGLRAFTLRNTGACPPAKFKLCLLELLPLETILYFDADARFLRPWDPHQYEDSPAVVTVLDWPSAARNVDCDAFGIDRNRYFASGFWIANARHHAAAWAAASKIAFAPDYRTAFKYEQTALNAAVQRAELPVTNLDRRYWWIPTRDHPAPPDVVTVARGGDAPEDQIAYDEAVRNARVA